MRIKDKVCPDCGKLIHRVSVRCRACSQKGNLNHQYKNGITVNDRFCKECGKRLSTGSKKGKCLGCYSKSIDGINNPNYRFGHYLRKFYNTTEYKLWRTLVYRRDNFTCQNCGNSKSGNLVAHHILPKRDHPTLVYTLSNGITLCKSCHKLTFKNEYAFVDYFNSLLLKRPNKNSVN